jgi:hypothetical protein
MMSHVMPMMTSDSADAQSWPRARPLHDDFHAPEHGGAGDGDADCSPPGSVDSQVHENLQKLLKVGVVERTRIKNRLGKGQAWHITIKHSPQSEKLVKAMRRIEKDPDGKDLCEVAVRSTARCRWHHLQLISSFCQARCAVYGSARAYDRAEWGNERKQSNVVDRPMMKDG